MFVFVLSNYEDLRKHFRDAHFLCEEGECKEEKFTRVFRTEIDIRAHKAQVTINNELVLYFIVRFKGNHNLFS